MLLAFAAALECCFLHMLAVLCAFYQIARYMRLSVAGCRKAHVAKHDDALEALKGLKGRRVTEWWTRVIGAVHALSPHSCHTLMRYVALTA